MIDVDLKSCRVLVTPTSYGQTDPQLRTELEAAVGRVDYNPYGRPLSAPELKELLRGCDGYIAGVDTIDRRVIKSTDRLRVIARYGSGVDNVDLAAAAEQSVVVTNTPSANAASVAEFTVGLVLALVRSIPALVNRTRSGEWPRVMGTSLEGRCVGLLGFGAIGKKVARYLSCFDCTLVAHDPVADEHYAARYGIELAALTDVVARADVLSLHLPLLPQTRGIVDSSFLARMKPGSFLINTARGELLDEAALLEALNSGHLMGAALDAFSEEPPAPDHPLLSMPQVLATPHSGAHTDGAARAMGWAALRDCMAVLRGEEPVHRIV
jgi:phosphoglycerate dehydrogenase-like enzyme